MIVNVIKSVWGESSVNLILDIDDIQGLFAIEVCPVCGEEQVVWSHGVTQCPECGAAIAPCSVCQDENGSCNYNTCPYGCDGTATDAEKPVTMPEITEGEAKLLYSFL